ncbi:MAG: substrate-binding domain-containing protein, partial [Litoreibacter sp.]
DAILVHSRDAEDAFLADHHGTHRTEIMYNDFVMIGPRSDPTAISEHTDIKSIFTDIHETQSAFISRGDDSGTHQKEIALWTNAELDPETFAAWYREVGAGMGAALNTAVGLNAYILADRASWLNFANKGQLKLLFSGDPSLFNQYAYIPVSPEKHSQIKHDEALRLEAWLVSNTAKALIDSYEIDGEKLFTFNAK